MSNHHSDLKCDRLQRLMTALEQAGTGGLTTMQLNEICSSTRSSSDVSELRACGVAVVCEYCGLTDNGRRLHKYYLAQYAPKDSVT